MSMFCFQCQETARGKGCDIAGVCGKKENTAKTMDLLIYALKGVSWPTIGGREASVRPGLRRTIGRTLSGSDGLAQAALAPSWS